jgi:hypothetical protein
MFHFLSVYVGSFKIAGNGGGLVFVCEANNTKLVLPVSPEGLNGSNQAAAVTGNPVRSPCAYEGLPVTVEAKSWRAFRCISLSTHEKAN